jgi:COP9 signalosome complex subunit 2
MVHICTLLYTQKKFGEMMVEYKKLLEFIPSVTRNEGADAIDAVLNACSDSSDAKTQTQIYEITGDALAKMPDSERMLFDVRMKLCRAHFGRAAFAEASDVLSMLHKACLNPDGSDDKKNKGSELIEIYALELQLSAAQGNNLKMKELYERTKDLTVAVKDPRSQSVIRECWGVMFGNDGQWARAKAEFFYAFIHYDEIGNSEKAKQCLKYVVVANMLSGADANPFDAREAKAYERDKEIEAVGELRKNYEKCDVNGFAKSLDAIFGAGDKFLHKHMDSMINDFQARATQNLIKSYRRIKLQHLAESLRVNVEKIEEILVHLILDGQVDGRIDQVKGVLDLTQRSAGGGKKYSALDVWAGTLSQIVANLPTPAANV